jgi:hypothetical protein
MKLNEKDNYDTFDMHQSGDRIILITDLENLKNYQEEIDNKLKCTIIWILIYLSIQIFCHSYISYYNLMDCEHKIKNYNKQDKDLTYVCATYMMHIFLIIGYFVIASITLYKQSRITFQIFEIYIMIMLIADLFFSHINSKSFYHVVENILTFLIFKYLKFLRDEYEKFCV